MFKYFKEMRELKRAKLQFQAVLMGKLVGIVDSLPDIVEIAKKAKDMDMTDFQELIAEELVKYVKTKDEDAKTEVTDITTPTEI